VRNNQAINLEEKFLTFNSQFNAASDTVHARMLQEVDHGMHMLTQEEQNISRIQDPPEMRGRQWHTFGKGGSCRCTATEIVEKELKRNDRGAPGPQQQSSQSETLTIDLTSSSAASQQVSGAFMTHSASQHAATPFIMTFSASGTVIRSPQWKEGPTADVQARPNIPHATPANQCK